MSITVRAAQLDDVDWIVRYNHALAQESEQRSLDLATLRVGVQAALEDSRKCRYFIAEFDGLTVGQTMVTYEWSDWRNGFFWWIQSVYVEPDYRRRGVFSALYRHVQDTARNNGQCCGVRLYVETGNQRARETYSQLGMQSTGYLVLEDDWSGTS